MTTIISWQDATQEACEFLVSHSADTHLAADTYFPCVTDLSDALKWFQLSSLHAWIIREGDTAVGLIATVKPNFVEIPARYVETCTYISPEQRGLGISVRAWQLAEPFLEVLCDGLAGATWCDNASSITRLRKSGFSFYEKVWFNSTVVTEQSGWCELWIKTFDGRT
jgi:hypothetical protein